MVKRQHGSDSDSSMDSGSEDGKPFAKKSRLNSSDEAPVNGSAPDQHLENGNAEYSSDEDESDEADEAEIKRMATQMSKPATGEVAQAGVVKSIECINFMCHKRLTVNFGPQINFVIGHNGSGKSAFLTALTIALGGKAASTGRAAGLKDFVRTADGVTQAQIILKLLNKGPDAWMPERYGDTITITRTINREGGAGGTKLSNTSGKVVASTKHDLQAICDHFNISVDNPINILSQDAARQFLTDSTPEKKYQLFLKGTLLSQLSEDYEKLQQSKHAISRALDGNLVALSELKKEQKVAAKKWEAASTVAAKAGELEKLEAMRAWAVAKKHEEAFEGVASQIAELESIMEATQNDIDKNQKVVLRADRELERIREQMQKAEEGDAGFRQELERVRSEIRENHNRAKRFNDEKRNINQEAQRLRIQLETFEGQIRSEQAKNENDYMAPREDLLRRIDEAKAAAERAEQQAREAQEEATTTDQDVTDHRNRARQLRDDVNRARDGVTAARSKLDQAQAARSNPMQAYGAGVPTLLRQIEQQRWHGSKPIGPIGSFVKVKEPVWCHALESVLGPILNGFIISDNRDKGTLFSLFARNNLRGARVYMAQDDPTFDPSSGEPDPSFRTIYRILHIEHNQVRTCLVNEAHIESSILVESRQEGNDIMYRRPQNVRSAYSIDAFQLGGAGMRQQEIALRRYEGPPRLSADPRAHIQQCQMALDEAQRLLPEADGRARQAETDLNASMQKRISAQNRERQLRSEAGRHRRNVDELEDEVQKMEPANIAHLEEGRRETQSLIEQISADFLAAEEQLQAAQSLNAPLLERKAELQAQLDGGQNARQERSEQEADAIRRKLQAESNIKQRKASYQKKQTELNGRQAALPNVSEAVDNAIKVAEGLCKDPADFGEDLDRPEKYDSQIKVIRKSIKENERRAGMSLEELRDQVASINAAYEKNRRDVQDLKRLFQAIEKSFNERSARWNAFTGQIAVRAKMNFINLMAGRNFLGQLKFNHMRQSLEILVETQEATAAVNDKRKREAKNLSGGEKSFSTVSFLLTLWESVGCPIRGLDEFDVFQDDEHRTASIGMLVDAAKSSNAKQYLFITPNPIVQQGPHIRIHRLSDPVRGQGTL